jgi:two-component system, OmpR family, sensor kinase
MNGNKEFNLSNIKIEKGFKFALYSDGNILYSQIKRDINITNDGYKTLEDNLIYIDSLVNGHLNISSIVIEENLISKYNIEILYRILLVITLIYLLIIFFGIYISRIFVRPIKDYRKKLDKFIDDTTHELNTPLSSLLLISNLEDLNTIDNRSYIKMSIKRISNLYKNLTYILSNDNNDYSYDIKDFKPIDISDILIKELIYFKQLAKIKNIRLNVNIDSIFYKISHEDISRLFNNLISNSIKYTNRFGTINIYLSKDSFVIEDNGIGISSQDQFKIFQRYYRIDSVQGGLGIGLDIVNNICTKYNIKISFYSKIDSGSTFKLFF